MNHTEKYHLAKPLNTEKYSIGIFNNNSDLIDSNLQRIDRKLEEQDVHLSKLTDTVYTHPDTHPASMIKEDESHLFLTRNEKNILLQAEKHSSSSHAPANAERNTLVGIKRNGSDLPIDAGSRTININVPTKLSELTNDSGFIMDSNNNYVSVIISQSFDTFLSFWTEVNKHKHSCLCHFKDTGGWGYRGINQWYRMLCTFQNKMGSPHNIDGVITSFEPNYKNYTGYVKGVGTETPTVTWTCDSTIYSGSEPRHQVNQMTWINL